MTSRDIPVPMNHMACLIREHCHAVTGAYVGRQALALTTTGSRSGLERVHVAARPSRADYPSVTPRVTPVVVVDPLP